VHRRLRLCFVALLLAALAPIVAISPAYAKSKVDTARETAKQVKAQLAKVTAELQQQQARNEAAKQSAAAARVRLHRAQAAEAEVQQHLAQVKLSLKSVALQFYMAGGNQASYASGAFVDPITAARANVLRSAVIGVQTDVVDELTSLRQDLDIRRRAAESAARVAADRQQAVGRTVAQLRASQAEQLRLVGAAESRYLASIKEADLASRSRRVRGSSIDLTTVRGITVATRIADNLERMLEAADADGMRFGGSGYRSPSGQVAARRRNCGSSEYDIYEKPSGRCHPPTAKPGQSMHEQGLAIDFTYNGSVINSHSNAGYQWLRGHASRYGFYNLPSEAWHWSVNGN
jgi:hypothetical protein